MKRHHAVWVSMVLLAACGCATPTSPSAFRTSATNIPSPPPTTTVPSPGQGLTLLPGPLLAAGARTEVRVEGTDSICFPNWDSGGHCRQFTFVAPTDGTLGVTLELPSRSRGMYDPEAFLVTPQGDWDFTSDPWPVRHVSSAAKGGLTYGIVVMSYGPFPDTVYLTVNVR
jgi:hypothetical protein